MQSYIGIFYHALLHRNIMTLRQVLIQRLIISEVDGIVSDFFHICHLNLLLIYGYCSQVLENMLENSLPYLKYSLKKYRAVG